MCETRMLSKLCFSELEMLFPKVPQGAMCLVKQCQGLAQEVCKTFAKKALDFPSGFSFWESRIGKYSKNSQKCRAGILQPEALRP